MHYDWSMHKRIHKQAESFRLALQGISWAFYTQPHFQFHVAVGIFVLIIGFVLNITMVEYAILLLTIFGVIVTELINTSVESLVNMATEEWHGHAKVAKDVCAGAVLMMTLAAVGVGSLVFVPRFLILVNTL